MTKMALSAGNFLHFMASPISCLQSIDGRVYGYLFMSTKLPSLRESERFRIITELSRRLKIGGFLSAKGHKAQGKNLSDLLKEFQFKFIIGTGWDLFTGHLEKHGCCEST